MKILLAAKADVGAVNVSVQLLYHTVPAHFLSSIFSVFSLLFRDMWLQATQGPNIQMWTLLSGCCCSSR